MEIKEIEFMHNMLINNDLYYNENDRGNLDVNKIIFVLIFLMVK